MISEIEEGKENLVSSAYFLDQALTKDPSSHYLQIQKAYELARQNKLDEALLLAEKIRKEKPKNEDVILLLGKLYAAVKKNSEAIEYLKLTISKDPSQEEAYHLLARQYLVIDKPWLSIRTINRLIKINPDSVSAYFFLGSLYASKIKNLNLAYKAYENIIQINPDDTNILNLLIEIRLKQKRSRDAIKLLERVFEINPENPEPEIKAALLYYDLGQIDQAINSFKKINKYHSKLPRILYYLGLLHAEKKEWDLALDYLSQVPGSSTLYEEATLKQVAYYKNQNQPEKAIKVLRKATKVAFKNPKLWDILASFYATQDNLEKAAAVILEGLKYLPDHEELNFSLAIIYERMDKWKMSISAMKNVVKVNPENAIALNYIGYTYAEKGIELEFAKEYIEKALALRPNDGFIVDSLGWVYFKKKDFQKALTLLKKANQLSPNEPAILEHIGDWYLNDKNKKKARHFYEEALFKSRNKKTKNHRLDELVDRIKDKISKL